MSTFLKDMANKGKGKGVETKMGTGGNNGPIFKDNTTYEVEITGLAVTESSGGFRQLEVALSKVMGDGSTKKAGRRWINLPVYSEDQENKYDAVKFKQMKGISQDNLLGFLAAALPGDFGPDAGSIQERKDAVIGLSEALVEAFVNESELPIDLTGNRLYYVSVAGTKTDAKGNIRHYDSFSAQPQDRFLMAEDI